MLTRLLRRAAWPIRVWCSKVRIIMQAEETYQEGDTLRLTHGLVDADGAPVPFDELYLVVHKGWAPHEVITTFESLEDEKKGLIYVLEEPGVYSFEWQARGQVSDTTPAFEGDSIHVKAALTHTS